MSAEMNDGNIEEEDNMGGFVEEIVEDEPEQSVKMEEVNTSKHGVCRDEEEEEEEKGKGNSYGNEGVQNEEEKEKEKENHSERYDCDNQFENKNIITEEVIDSNDKDMNNALNWQGIKGDDNDTRVKQNEGTFGRHDDDAKIEQGVKEIDKMKKTTQDANVDSKQIKKELTWFEDRIRWNGDTNEGDVLKNKEEGNVTQKDRKSNQNKSVNELNIGDEIKNDTSIHDTTNPNRNVISNECQNEPGIPSDQKQEELKQEHDDSNNNNVKEDKRNTEPEAPEAQDIERNLDINWRNNQEQDSQEPKENVKNLDKVNDNIEENKYTKVTDLNKQKNQKSIKTDIYENNTNENNQSSKREWAQLSATKSIRSQQPKSSKYKVDSSKIVSRTNPAYVYIKEWQRSQDYKTQRNQTAKYSNKHWYLPYTSQTGFNMSKNNFRANPSKVLEKTHKKMMTKISDPKNPYSTYWSNNWLKKRYDMEVKVSGFLNGVPVINLKKPKTAKTVYLPYFNSTVNPYSSANNQMKQPLYKLSGREGNANNFDSFNSKDNDDDIDDKEIDQFNTNQKNFFKVRKDIQEEPLEKEIDNDEEENIKVLPGI